MDASFGGEFDAIYLPEQWIWARSGEKSASFARLAEHFFQAFPQLEGLHFTHAWGGAIDTCSALVHFGERPTTERQPMRWDIPVGVGASRFGAPRYFGYS